MHRGSRLFIGIAVVAAVGAYMLGWTNARQGAVNQLTGQEGGAAASAGSPHLIGVGYPATGLADGRGPSRLEVVFPSPASMDGAWLEISIASEGHTDFLELITVDTRADWARIRASFGNAGTPEVELDGQSIGVSLPALPWGDYQVSARTLEPSPMLLTAGPVRFGSRSQPGVTLSLVPAASGIAHLNVLLRRADASVQPDAVIKISGERGFVSSVDTSSSRHGGLLSVPQGAYTVQVVSYPGHEWLGLPSPQRVVLQGRTLSDLEFRLSPAPAIHVFAESPTGERIPFTLALWARTDAGSLEGISVASLFTMQAGGAEWVGRLPVGRYHARVSPKHHFGEERIDFDVIDREEPVVVVVGVDVARYPPVHVRVLSPEGEPQVGARMTVNSMGDRVESSISGHALTRLDGVGVTRPLPHGRYSVWFWDLGLMCFLNHEGDGTVHQVRLGNLDCDPVGSCAELRGRVGMRDGGRAPARHVVLVDAFADPFLSLHRISPVGGNSVYEFTQLLPGTYRLWTPWAPQYRPRIREYYSEPFELRQGERSERELRLEPEAEAEPK